MVSQGFKAMLAKANAIIDTISVQEAMGLADNQGVAFIDVRDIAEVQEHGAIAGAVHAPRGFLEFIADPEGPMHDAVFASGKRMVLYCGTGGRSALACKTLMDMGLDNVCSVAGGFAAWCEAGGPVQSKNP